MHTYLCMFRNSLSGNTKTIIVWTPMVVFVLTFFVVVSPSIVVVLNFESSVTVINKTDSATFINLKSNN